MSDHSADEAAIRQHMQTATDTLNRGDAKAGAAHFTQDADTINSLGQVAKGPANIEQATQALLTGPYQGATFAIHIENIRFLTPAIAIADAAGDITRKQGPPTKMSGVWVLVKQDGQWLFTAARTWVPATAPV
jgi:uncharacterized protein (TIGR02246 family)